MEKGVYRGMVFTPQPYMSPLKVESVSENEPNIITTQPHASTPSTPMPTYTPIPVTLKEWSPRPATPAVVNQPCVNPWEALPDPWLRHNRVSSVGWPSSNLNSNGATFPQPNLWPEIQQSPYPIDVPLPTTFDRLPWKPTASLETKVVFVPTVAELEPQSAMLEQWDTVESRTIDPSRWTITSSLGPVSAALMWLRCRRQAKARDSCIMTDGDSPEDNYDCANGSPVTAGASLQRTYQENLNDGTIDTGFGSITPLDPCEPYMDAYDIFSDEAVVNDDNDLMQLDPCDLFTVTVAEQYGLEEGPEATVDSGATASVANPRTHFPGAVVQPSEASRRGVKYQGAGKEIIDNEGEMSELLMTGEGVISDTTWPAADVRKPLLAVSGCNDKGNCVWFDNENSCILSANCPELASIRRLVAQAKRKIAIARKGGTYKLRTWRVPRDHKPAQGFPRQGRA